MSDYHKSVLLNQVIGYLKVIPGNKYIDATLGGGGHTFEILKRGGRVLGLDVDNEAIDFVENKIKDSGFRNNLIITKGNFRNIDDLAIKNSFGKVDGIIFDLGVSSHQLDTKDRGFSFKFDTELDMRMDRELGVKALDLLKVLKKGELYELFKNFGEESNALRIASDIVESRRVKPIETTTELERIVLKSIKVNKAKINPATKAFQALRIAVNDELGALNEALPKALGLLKQNGRILAISFHSLEDRIIKHTYIKWNELGYGEIVTKKPVIPDEDEILANPRSRSAKLRIFEKS